MAKDLPHKVESTILCPLTRLQSEWCKRLLLKDVTRLHRLQQAEAEVERLMRGAGSEEQEGAAKQQASSSSRDIKVRPGGTDASQVWSTSPSLTSGLR